MNVSKTNKTKLAQYIADAQNFNGNEVEILEKATKNELVTIAQAQQSVDNSVLKLIKKYGE